MMIDNQTNFLNLFIAKDVAKSTAVADGVAVTPAQLSTGEVVVTDPAGRFIAAANAVYLEPFKLAMKNANGKIVWSDVVYPANGFTDSAKLSAAATEKIEYIGYNGTSGSINVQNSTLYEARILLLPSAVDAFAQQRVRYMVYKSDTTATQLEIAAGLCENMANNYALNKEPEVKVERVLSDAGVANAINAGADYTHFLFTKGSKIVVGTNSAGVAMNGSDETNANLVAGVYFRVGTAVTDPVYKVSVATAGTGATPAGTPFMVELDVAYQGETTIIAVASTEYITAALASAASVGIKITGLPRTYQAGIFQYDKVDFNVTLMNGFNTNGTTLQTTSQNASLGVGTYQEIAEKEWVLQFNRRGVYTSGSPADTLIYGMESNVETDHYYSVMVINFKQSDTSSLGATTSMPKQIIIAGNAGTTAATACTGTSIADELRGTLGVILHNHDPYYDLIF